MAKSLYYCELILNLNERLFSNTLAGITEEQAEHRITDHNNPLRWIIAHTVSARYNMLLFLGKPTHNPYSHLFENFKAYDKALKYPTMDEIRTEWQKATVLLKDALKTVSEEHLSADSPLKNPIRDFPNRPTFSFMLQ